MMINIKKVKTSDRDRARILPVLERNWVSIHAETVALPHNERGLKELLKYVKLEYGGKRREYVIHRLYRKACTIRRDLEEHQIYG